MPALPRASVARRPGSTGHCTGQPPGFAGTRHGRTPYSLAMTPTRFTGRKALVTGAASGIGRATALRLATEGADVVAVDVNADLLGQLEAEASGLVAGRSPPWSATSPPRRAWSPWSTGSVDRARGARRGGQRGRGALVLPHPRGHHLGVEPADRHQPDRHLPGLPASPSPTCWPAGATSSTWPRRPPTPASPGPRPTWPPRAGYWPSPGPWPSSTPPRACGSTASVPGRSTRRSPGPSTCPEGADIKLLGRVTPLGPFGTPEGIAAAIAFVASDEASHMNGADLLIDGATLA